MSLTANARGPVIIDVGPDGIYGFYARMRSQLSADLPSAFVWAGLWLWVLSWPSEFVIYQVTPDISVVGIIKVVLGLSSAQLAWRLVKALSFGLRWLRLEAQGLYWIERNEHSYRVTLLRRDGSFQFNTLTWEQRLDQEVSSVRHRRQAFLRDGPALIIRVVGFVLIPTAINLAYHELSYFEWGRAVVTFLRDWKAVGVVEWLWFFFCIVPGAVALGLLAVDELTYRAGAQFVPGAKVLDPPRPPRTLESVHAQKFHGAADFVPADDAADHMSGS
jgi:hypothetical protein